MIARSWTPQRATVAAAGAALLATALLVYTPMLDVVVLVLTGPGIVLSAIAAWRGGRGWETAAAALVAIPALLVLLLFGEIAWLADPSRGPFGDYLSIVTLAVALLLATPVLLARIPRLRADGRTMRAYVTAVLLVALGASAATGAALRNAPAGGGGYDVPPDARVELRVIDGAFAPTEISVVAGALTEIVLVNEDDTWHTLSYARDGEARHHRVLPLDTSRLLVRFDAPGEIGFWCEPHASTMKGTIRVVPAAPP